MAEPILYGVIAIVLAVVVDLWIMRRVRQFLHRSGPEMEGGGASGQAVYVFGNYSPMLTWLKRRGSLNRPVDLRQPIETPQAWHSNVEPDTSPEKAASMLSEAEQVSEPDSTASMAVTNSAKGPEHPVPAKEAGLAQPDLQPGPNGSQVPPRRIAKVQFTLEVAEGTQVELVVQALPDGQVGLVQSPGASLDSSPDAGHVQIVNLTSESSLGPVPLPPAAEISASVPTGQERAGLFGEAVRAAAARVNAALESREALLPRVLFGISLAVLALTLFVRLDEFPIFFYSDEANVALLGDELLQHGLRNSTGEFLPVYFDWDNRWAPALPVYWHLLTTLIFGKTIFAVRATVALVTLLAAASVGLTLKLFFEARYWWAGVLMLVFAPIFILYARTGFVVAYTPAFFALFLLCYLMYRLRSPRYLYAAIVAGAFIAYSYSIAQFMMVLLAGLLFVADLKYHLSHKPILARGLLLAGVLAWPFVSFTRLHPQGMTGYLSAIDSFWVQALPLTDKLGLYAKNYLLALSPTYWFLPENIGDNVLPSMRFDGQAHMSLLLLPLLVAGLIICVKRWQSPSHRLLLLAALVVPAGAALDVLEVRRVMSFVIQVVLMSALGLQWFLDRLAGVSNTIKATALAAVLMVGSLATLREMTVNGPLWNEDYGLYGMQYGVKQIFADTIPDYLRREPDATVVVSTGWANNVDFFPKFFYPLEQRSRVVMGNIEDYLNEQRGLDGNTVVILMTAEYDRAVNSPILESFEIEDTIYYPNGVPAFYVTRPKYVTNVDEIFAAKLAERHQPVEEPITLNGQIVTVLHSKFEGTIDQLFDGDPNSLVRGVVDNPFIVDMTFPAPQPISEVAITVGSFYEFTVTLTVEPADGGDAIVHSETYRELPADPTVQLSLPAGTVAAAVRIEILDTMMDNKAQIHVRDIVLR